MLKKLQIHSGMVKEIWRTAWEHVIVQLLKISKKKSGVKMSNRNLKITTSFPWYQHPTFTEEKTHLLQVQDWSIRRLFLAFHPCKSPKNFPRADAQPATVVITWHQPKQCTIKWKSLKITVHLHCLIPLPPQIWVISWSLPDLNCSFF